MSVTALPRPGTGVPLVIAVDRFLDRFRDVPTTRSTYAGTLARLRDLLGDAFPTGDLSCEQVEAVMTRWDASAANTWNKHLSALTSFIAYARRQDWLTGDPCRRLERRKIVRDRDKAIPRARLERLFADDRNALRERVLWRFLYETGVETGEVA